MSNIRYKHPLLYFTAMVFAVPNVVIVWLVIMYPVYGLTGEVLHPFFHVLTCLIVFLILWSWALIGSQKNFEIMYRSCRLGSLLTLLLPFSTGMTSLFWVLNVTERPEAILSGYSAVEIPVFTAGAAILLIILFLFGSYTAAKNMDGIPF
jgi:hypothetical protein